jgi:2-oxo-4-hydroxy-4-carboxy-5-ureidoimidazoline decarboxylase
VTLEVLNAMPEAELLTLLEGCGSPVWARQVAAQRPFPDQHTLVAAADAAWALLDDGDWLDTFEEAAAHVPETGDDGTRAAAVTALQLYRARFRRAFVTAADCQAADELLMRVRIRLGLDERAEWRASCDEQRRLTRRHLERLLSGAR